MRPGTQRRPSAIARRGARLALLCVFAALTRATGQDAPLELDAGRVHVNDSFEARAELERIALLVERQQWPDVVRRCQALVDVHGDMLIERDGGLYVSVAAEVASRLAAMPTPAVRAYRSEFESVARAAPGAAPETREVDVMLRFVEDYFCTQIAGRVAERAAELLCEDGRFDLAAALTRRLLDRHPDFVSRPPEKTARLGIMLAWAGRLDDATTALNDLRERAPATMVRWGDETLPATEVLAEQIERMRQRSPAPGPFAWPMFGGDATRARVIESNADAGAALWRFAIDSTGTSDDAEPRSAESSVASMFPVMVDDVIYFQDAMRAWAVDAATGRLRWRYDATPADPGASDGFGERTTPPLYVPAVDRGAAYFVFGEAATSYFGSTVQQGRVALVRLDLDGTLVWRLGAEGFGHAFARVHLDPAPVVDGDHVFVTVRRQKTSGFEDCLLARVDADDGSIDWQVHLSSAAIGGYGYRVPTLSMAAKTRDLVYVCTNLGTIAAVDAWTGRVRWLRQYPRIDPGQGGALLARSVLPESPHDYHPVFCANDMVVALPTDGTSMLVLDPADGSIIGDVPRSTLGDPVTLLGVHDGALFALGRELVCWDLREGRSHWSRPRPDDPLRGRPSLSASAVYWPGTRGIVRWELGTSASHRSDWDDPALGGNLLATPDQLVVLSATQLSLMERKSSAIARLRGRVAAAPDDPRPRLDLAEVTLRTGDVEIGAAALREVVDRLADPASADLIADALLRKRLHDACMAYGANFRAPLRESNDEAVYWIRAAGRHAATPDEQIDYRMTLADVLAETGDTTGAIGVYRQIIVDGTLRDFASGQSESQSQPAGALAAEQIQGLIVARGREVYAPFEREAEAALRVAEARESLDELDAVVRLYPNAVAAARALLSTGELLARDDQPLAAARRFYRALTSFPERIEQPEVTLRLAECYRAGNRPDAALAWVAKGARLFPSARVRVDQAGAETFDEIAERWRGELAVRPARGPTLVPPLHRADDLALGSSSELLEPTLDRRSDGRRTSFFVYADQVVTCRSGVTGDAVWPAGAPCRVKPALLKLDDELAVLATRHQVFALKLADGSRAWSVGKYPADVDDANTDPEWFDVFERHVVTDDVLVSIKSNDETIRIDPATGNVEWSVMLPGRPRGGVALDDHLFAFVEVVGEVGFENDRSLLWLVDAATGALRHRIELTHRDSVPANGLRFTPDGTLLLATTRRLEVFEAGTGERLWEAVTERHIQTDTLAVGVDGIFAAEKDGRLVKRSLIDGRALWSQRLIGPEERVDGPIVIQLSGATLVASTMHQLVIFDTHDGRVVREIELENDDEEFVFVTLTPDAVLAVAAGAVRAEGDAEPRERWTARFLPRADRLVGGPDAKSVDLGELQTAPDAIVLNDHVLLAFQNGIATRWIDGTTVGP